MFYLSQRIEYIVCFKLHKFLKKGYKVDSRSTFFFFYFFKSVYMGRLIELGNSIKKDLKKEDLETKKSVFMLPFEKKKEK